MKIQYKNFTIEDDRNCFIVSEFGIRKKGENIGEECLTEQVYPGTLKQSLEWISNRLKKNDNGIYELKEAIQEIDKINNDFIKDLEILVSKII